jgi:hypothetical protein
MFRRVWLTFVLAGCTAEPAPVRPLPAADDLPEPPGPPGPPEPPEPPGMRQGPAGFVEASSVCRQVVVGGHSSCAVHWTQACDRALLAAAYRNSEKPARTGACYYHDRTTCPDCACEFYLKVGKLGFDGGTGCLRSLDDVARELRTACAEQRCEP